MLRRFFAGLGEVSPEPGVGPAAGGTGSMREVIQQLIDHTNKVMATDPTLEFLNGVDSAEKAMEPVLTVIA